MSNLFARALGFVLSIRHDRREEARLAIDYARFMQDQDRLVREALDDEIRCCERLYALTPDPAVKAQLVSAIERKRLANQAILTGTTPVLQQVDTLEVITIEAEAHPGGDS